MIQAILQQNHLDSCIDIVRLDGLDFNVEIAGL